MSRKAQIQTFLTGKYIFTCLQKNHHQTLFVIDLKKFENYLLVDIEDDKRQTNGFTSTVFSVGFSHPVFLDLTLRIHCTVKKQKQKIINSIKNLY